MGRDATTSQPTTKQRNNTNSMPSLDDIIMQITGMSQALCKPGRIVHRWIYDAHRPPQWPTAFHFLAFYGFEASTDGWHEFIESMILKPKEMPKWCKNCGDPRLWCLGRCQNCDRYWRRTGKERPKHLWNRREQVCSNCKFPIAAAPPFKRGERRQCAGRCQPCHSYWKKYHKERPKELWGDGPYGFCECGYPAVALVEDIPVCVRHRE